MSDEVISRYAVRKVCRVVMAYDFPDFENQNRKAMPHYGSILHFPLFRYMAYTLTTVTDTITYAH